MAVEKKETRQVKVMVECTQCSHKVDWVLGETTSKEAFLKKAEGLRAEKQTVPCPKCYHNIISAVWSRWFNQGAPFYLKRVCRCNGCRGNKTLYIKEVA